MKLEEYEDLLEKPSALKKTYPLKAITVEISTNPVVTQLLSSTHRNPDYSITNTKMLNDAEKQLISNDCVTFVNSVARFLPLENQTIHMIKQELESFLSTYMYRWYIWLRLQHIKCESKTETFGYKLSIYLDREFICDIGVGRYASL